MKIYKFLLLLILLLLVSYPRFNWKPLPSPLNSFVGTKPFDVEQYEKYVDFFRGNTQLRSELEGPFSYRPLVPFLASFFPFDALTSINIVNLIFLGAGVFYLVKLLLEFKIPENLIFIGLIIFIVSFPLFYYATSGYIDASLIGILLIINYYLFSGKYIYFIISFLFGIFVKETTIILVPVAAVYFLLNENSKRKILKSILPVFLYLIAVAIIRSLAPQKENYIWKPSLEIFIFNISRVKTYLTFFLTLGIPGLLTIYLIFTDKKKSISKEILLPLITGFSFSILLWTYSLFAAYSDGRQLWISYVFSIPLMLGVFNPKIMTVNNPE